MANEPGCDMLLRERGAQFHNSPTVGSNMKRLLLTLFLLAAATTHATIAADWPQWRGPHRDGTSQEPGLLGQWSADGPALVWQADDVDYGYGTPAVAGDRL